MPQSTTEQVQVIQTVSIPVEKEIHNLAIDSEGDVYWDVIYWELDSQGNRKGSPMKKEYYSSPFAGFISMDGEKIDIRDIEGQLWSKVAEIDAMSDEQKINFKKNFKQYIISLTV